MQHEWGCSHLILCIFFVSMYTECFYQKPAEMLQHWLLQILSHLVCMLAISLVSIFMQKSDAISWQRTFFNCQIYIYSKINNVANNKNAVGVTSEEWMIQKIWTQANIAQPLRNNMTSQKKQKNNQCKSMFRSPKHTSSVNDEWDRVFISVPHAWPTGLQTRQL